MILKRTNFFFLASILFVSSSLAQNAQSTAVSETTETIQGIYGDALHVKIHRASKKEIIKALKNDWKEKNGEIESKKNEIIGNGIIIPSVNSEGLKLLAKIRDFTKLEHELLVIFQKGSETISPGSTSYNNAKAYLFELANNISKSSNISHHEIQEKKLKHLENELRDLNVRIEKDADKIKKLEKSIKKEQKKIDNVDEQKTLDQKSIELRKKAVEKVIKCREKSNNLEYDITINKENVKNKKDAIKSQKEIVENAKKDREVFE
tara:strand:- start:2081 stop:2872 length:792 start_codon:yes stop_codon:yes gene_type:complete